MFAHLDSSPDMQHLAPLYNPLGVGHLSKLEDAHEVIHFLVEYHPFVAHSSVPAPLVTLDASSLADSPKRLLDLHS
jgi:hypothetical protein